MLNQFTTNVTKRSATSNTDNKMTWHCRNKVMFVYNARFFKLYPINCCTQIFMNHVTFDGFYSFYGLIKPVLDKLRQLYISVDNSYSMYINQHQIELCSHSIIIFTCRFVSHGLTVLLERALHSRKSYILPDRFLLIGWPRN